MFKINNIPINVNKFPDGTQCIMDFNEFIIYTNYENIAPYYEIVWLYESDEEVFTLMCLVNHIRDNHKYSNNLTINLILSYVPNSRMDRVHSIKEIFTLKHFTRFINSLTFNKVGVFDVHSNVTLALIDRVYDLKKVDECVTESLLKITDVNQGDCFDDIVLYFPDEGAYKRYKNFSFTKGRKFYYGKKTRDWDTGNILGLEVYNDRDEKVNETDVKDKIFLMIDDIISYGGTMAYSADKLKELGAKQIYAYASHTENSVLNSEKGTFLKRLDYGTIDGLFTTNSIYKGSHPRISVIHIF